MRLTALHGKLCARYAVETAKKFPFPSVCLRGMHMLTTKLWRFFLVQATP